MLCNLTLNPETQRVKSLWQTYHALFAAAQQQQSAFLRCLAFAATVCNFIPAWLSACCIRCF